MIDKKLLDGLLQQAAENPRKRMNYDMRTSPEDGSQRMLNAILPGSVVPIHRHPRSNENMILITGKLEVVMYEEVIGTETTKRTLKEVGRFHLCIDEGCYGCQVPKGVWHTVQVIEPSVIYEAKDGRYGEDGSETYEG